GTRRCRPRGRRGRRLARRRGRGGRTGRPAQLRPQPPRGTRPLEWHETRRRPRLSFVHGQGACLNVDPADLGFAATAVRLLRVWREQWRLVLLGFTCAIATTAFALAIPILIRHAIDNSIAPVDGPRASLYP